LVKLVKKINVYNVAESHSLVIIQDKHFFFKKAGTKALPINVITRIPAEMMSNPPPENFYQNLEK